MRMGREILRLAVFQNKEAVRTQKPLSNSPRWGEDRVAIGFLIFKKALSPTGRARRGAKDEVWQLLQLR